MDNKKKNIIIITIIVLVLIIVAMIIFFVLNNKNKEKSSQPASGSILENFQKENAITNIENEIASTEFMNEEINTSTNSNSISTAPANENKINDDNNSTNNKENVIDTTEPVITKENLTQSEKDYFKNYFKKVENNGFLRSSYSNPNEIDLALLLYDGIGETSEIPQNEISDFLLKVNMEELQTDLTKLTTSQIKSFLKEKMNYDITNISAKLNWQYLSKYDAYYHQHGDTAFLMVHCVDGYKTNDNQYVVSFKEDSEFSSNKKYTITLQKQGDKYIVCSNVIE